MPIWMFCCILGFIFDYIEETLGSFIPRSHLRYKKGPDLYLPPPPPHYLQLRPYAHIVFLFMFFLLPLKLTVLVNQLITSFSSITF